MAAPFVLSNGLVLLGGNTLTGNTNQIALSYGAQALDDTRLGNLTKVNAGGLKKVGCSVKGYMDFVTADVAMFNDMGLSDVLTLATAVTEGSADYFFKPLVADFQWGGKQGINLPFSLTAQAAGDLIRGTLIANKTGITTTGNGTGFQLGAVLAAQKVYGALHVLSIAGTSTPTITALLQSSVDNTFAAPTTRLSFTAATAVGAQFLSAAGAITDQWWRISYTISGSSPVFGFVLSVGIQ